MQRQFRCHSKKENRLKTQFPSKMLARLKANTENIPEYEKLSYLDIQKITRSMISDPKVLERNMGVISSIKGKMYCLKLGEVSSSKEFSHYFYSKQFRVKSQKGEPLGKLSSNSMYSKSRERMV